MPRVSRAQAEEHRKVITAVSARLFKERGIKAVSIADLMGAAGLTHGAFYGHFESKEALAGVAAKHAFEESTARWRRRIADKQGSARRETLVNAYLDSRNVRKVGRCCPTVSLAADVAREAKGSPVRSAYAQGFGELVDILASTEETGDGAGDRQAALSDYATMVGALMLARATEGTPLSGELLDAARERLNRCHSASTPKKAAGQALAPTRRKTAKVSE